MKRWLIAFFATVGLCLAAFPSRADQVEMLNGDRYTGRVVSLNADTLVLDADAVGTLKLPRSKVSTLLLTPPPASGKAPAPAAATTSATSPPKAPAEVAAAMRQLTNSAHANPESPVALLESAGPEAKAKFNELLGGFLSGKLSMSDIRAQAKSTADQVRALRGELGEDSASFLDGYLAILDRFVAETPAASPPQVKSPPPTQGPGKP